jgi:hypothetical protein
VKLFKNPDAQWREEDSYRKQAFDGLESGAYVA